ncbi:hypothetical protein COB55_03630 [Candidatus Wolfebacteria bacterium]|nr:MAG: hypothetical protein COB55_03630 [Candidatus Wolfebacteria bacterium]
MKKLSSLEIIQKISVHPNADKLELSTVLGFQCIIPKDQYKEGDKIIFIQPDTILPDSKWCETYKKYSPKRVKCVKLRNEWSEGIIVPLDLVNHLLSSNLVVGEDYSKELGVIKYDPPVPQDLQSKGYLPLGLGKTDEERFENLEDKIPFGAIVDVTLKIDGQSCTYYYDFDKKSFGVCGRNLEIIEDSVNNYTLHIPKIKDKLIEFCESLEVSLAIRGESYGQGIQKGDHNPYSKLSKSFACFSVYNLKERKYEHKGSKFYYINVCEELGLETVPIIEEGVVLTKELIEKYSTGLKKIDGQSFEGIVIKHSNGSFKVINKYYDSFKP